MINIISKERVFSLQRIYFPDAEEMLLSKSKVDVVRLLRTKELLPLRYGISLDTSETLISKLEDDCSMLSKFTKTVQYEIRRCLTRDQTLISFYSPFEEKRFLDILIDFQTVYDHFCDASGQPQLKKDFDRRKIDLYIKNKCILISCIEYENGKTYHIYLIDNPNALLIYSASDFRNLNVDKALAARANKLLHFKDMLLLRDRGFILYDWGNVSSFEHPNGIDVFKSSFGGTPEVFYNYFIGNTCKGKLFVELRRLLKNY